MARSIEMTELERKKLADAGRQSIPCTHGWRPIETAPKDGAHFLATSQSQNDIFICTWKDKTMVHSTDKEHHLGWWLVGVPKNYRLGWGPFFFPIKDEDLIPTHWQPLPKPPQE